MQEHRKKIPAGKPFDTQGFALRLEQLVCHWPSTSALARAAGVSEGAIRNYLKATVRPTRNNLYALALALGVTPQWLSDGQGALPPPAGEKLDEKLNEASAALPIAAAPSLSAGQVMVLGALFAWVVAQPESKNMSSAHWQQLLPTAYDLVRLARAAGQPWPEKSLQALLRVVASA